MCPEPAGESAPVIVFDGICVLCNGWIRFLLERDRGRYRFASMQSAAGRELLTGHRLDPEDPASFLLVEQGQAWTDSEAIQRVLTGLGGAWKVAGVIGWIPRVLRDRAVSPACTQSLPVVRHHRVYRAHAGRARSFPLIERTPAR